MFEEEKRRLWLKKHLRKQIIDYLNAQRVVVEIADQAAVLEELAKDLRTHPKKLIKEDKAYYENEENS